MLRGHCLVASLTAFCGVFLAGSLVFIGFMFKDMHDLVHSAKEDLKEYNVSVFQANLRNFQFLRNFIKIRDETMLIM